MGLGMNSNKLMIIELVISCYIISCFRSNENWQPIYSHSHHRMNMMHRMHGKGERMKTILKRINGSEWKNLQLNYKGNCIQSD